MRVILKAFQLIYCLYAFVIFVALLLLVFPLALIASFWGRLTGGNLIYRICRFWGNSWMVLVGILHKNIFESPLAKDKQYVFVANHISYLDIPVIFNSIRHQKLRVLGKFELKRIPVFGFIYQRAVIMVDRSNPNQRSKSVRQLRSVLRKGISVFIFPEGTFNETNKPLKEFYDGAFRIAIETGTPILPILFLDTHDRLHYNSIFSLRPGKSRSVFLEEIPVSGLTLKDMADLKKRVFDEMEGVLISRGVSWIGKSA
jgi:1-acyl-sn-glycerol-3-phosphate acyltransferase